MRSIIGRSNPTVGGSDIYIHTCLFGITEEGGDGDAGMVAIGGKALDAVVVELVAFLAIVSDIESADVMEYTSSFFTHFERDAEADVAPAVIAGCDIDAIFHDAVCHCADLFRYIDIGPLLRAE